MKLKIQEIADLKEGRKSLTQIQKDGNYPKYLYRQITEGIEETITNIDELLESHKMFEEYLLSETLKEKIPLDYNYSNEPYRIAIERMDSKIILEKDFPIAFAWEQVMLMGKDFKTIRNNFDNILKRTDGILHFKDLNVSEQQKLGADMESLLRKMTMQKPISNTLSDYSEKYNDVNHERYIQNLRKWDKSYRKLYNNIKKLDNKYNLGLNYNYIKEP